MQGAILHETSAKDGVVIDPKVDVMNAEAIEKIEFEGKPEGLNKPTIKKGEKVMINETVREYVEAFEEFNNQSGILTQGTFQWSSSTFPNCVGYKNVNYV